MKNKSLLTLTSISTVTLLMCIGVVSLTGNNAISLSTRADQDYSLTIDTSNVSNFSYVEEGLYRGTFKTALGNDVIFTTNKQGNSLSDNKIYWSVDNYLKSETALTGLKSIEVTASTNIGDKAPYRNYPTIRAEVRVDPNQTESFYYVDKTTNTRDSKTYTINIDEEGSGNYVNLKMVDIAEGAEGQLIISSIKFYFSCSNVKNLVKVSSTNESYGTVSIEGYGSNEQIVANGTQITIHANPLTNYQTEFFASFKGWHLNGSEEVVSRDFDITFTTELNKSYVYVAEFEEAETELFDQGVDTSGDKLTTYVKNKNNKYYPLNSVKDDETSFPTALTDKANELFIAQHFNRDNYLTHLELNIDRKGHGNWEPFDPDKIQAVIFYMNMDQPTQYDPVGIDQFVITNGTLTTYSGLKDKTDGNKAMSKVVWTNFTSDKAEFYVPNEYRDPDNIIKHNIWIKRMLVIER